MSLAAIPEYDFLPAPLWIITILHVLTLTLHFTAMNFMVGGIVVLVFGKIDDKWNHPFVRRYLKLFPPAMAATVSLGVAPLLFVQLVYGRQIYAASIVSGWFWLAIPLVAMVVYYFLYASSFSREGSRKPRTWLSISLVGLVFVSFVYSTVFALSENAGLQATLYGENPHGLILNSDVGAWMVRWLHMLTGAVTVGAFFVGWLGRAHDQVFATAKRWFLGAMIVAMILGVGYLLMLGDHLKPFMKSAGIWALTLSVVLSLGTLHFFFKKKFWGAFAMLFVSLAGMVITRHSLRLVTLEGTFDPAEWRVSPQWDVFALFLVFFLIAVGLVIWMLKIFFGSTSDDAAA